MTKQVGDRDPHYKYQQVKPCRDPEKPGYIIKLTGWSALWDTVSRQEIRVGKMSKVVKVASLEAKRKKTEIEKRIFVRKYFGNIETPIFSSSPDVTMCGGSEINTRSTSSILKGGSKRKQSFDNIFECGENQSSGKIRKKQNQELLGDTRQRLCSDRN